MAYQTRQRDPLLDTRMRAALARRGEELLGLALLAGAAALAAMLLSYAPDDPNFMAATDAAPRNLLGRPGASIAAIFIVIVGYSALILPLAALAWGARFLAHRGTVRALGRVIFLPIAVALFAIYAASHTPPPSWAHGFGLGGLFGDMILGAVLGALPLPPPDGLKLLAGVAFVAGFWLFLFTVGVTRRECGAALRFFRSGLAAAWAAAVAAGRRGGHGRPARDREPAHAKPGLLSRVPLLRARAPLPEPELVQPAARDPENVDAPDTDRIRAKIADVIRNRVSRGAPPVEDRREPVLTPRSALVVEPHPAHVAGGADGPRADLRRRVVRPAQKRPAAPSRQALAAAQPSLPLQQREVAYEPPPPTLPASPLTVQRHHLSDEALEENARMLENVLDDYGVKGEIVSVRPGPVVTMYELEPAPGLKASRVIGLADDIARSMSALSARVSTVPGRTVIGIELPNQNRERVVLREILSHREFGDGNLRLPLALGKDIGGDPVIANLARMPHLLIAGTTGSGKSVAINTMILSLLYKLTPEDCRMILIDPKMLELSVYDSIPHLLSPVVTDPKKAVVALKWVVGEMEERYRKMSKMGVRNIEGYNGRVEHALTKGETFSRTVQTGFDDDTGDPVFETEEFEPEKMPFIVVVVDEMADLMMVAGKEIEACIQRLAQMARASGIHIVMATQRPSVDVITGTIKANFPTRISFHVTSKVDSRTILGEMGAEQLLGMGDMLYMAGGAKITRVHGPFVSDEEVEEIVGHLKSFGPPDYAANVLDGPDEDSESDIDAVLGLNVGGNATGEDALYDQAVAVVAKDRKCSTSYIQRRLGIGYNKAARLVEQMEDQGLVSPANPVGKREILVPERP